MRAYSFFRVASPYVVPVNLVPAGNGPWDSLAEEIANDRASRPSTPLIITRQNPSKPLHGDDNGRVWTPAELADGYAKLAAGLKRRKVKFTLIDDDEYDDGRTSENDDLYYQTCVLPLLGDFPDLKWANYDVLPGGLLGDLQPVLNPALYLNDGWEPATPPRTPAQVVEWSLAKLEACLATGKPVYPDLASLANARDDITPDMWQSHLDIVASKCPTVMLFDETRGVRSADEGADCRDGYAAVARKLRAA